VPVGAEDAAVPRGRAGLYVAIGLGALVVLGAVGFVGSRFLFRPKVPRSVAAVNAVAPALPQPPSAEPRAAAGADAPAPTAAPAAAAGAEGTTPVAAAGAESEKPVAAAGADGAAPAAVAAAPAEPAAAPAAGAPLDAGAAAAAGKPAAEPGKPAAEPAPEPGKPAAEPAPAARKPAPAAAAKTEDAALSAAAKRKLKQKEREALMRQGYELIANNQQSAAREALNKALKLGDDPGVRELLAMSHRRSGEMAPAAVHLERAAAASSGVSRARRYVAVGDLYLQLGKKADACRAYRSAASAAPSFEPAQKQLANKCGGTN
jgi:light-harvesting protein B-800-850 alpha chain